MRYDCTDCEGAGLVSIPCRCHDSTICPNHIPDVVCKRCDGEGLGPECCDLCKEPENAPLPGATICQGCVEELADEAVALRKHAEELEWLAKEMVAGRLKAEKPRHLKAVGND